MVTGILVSNERKKNYGQLAKQTGLEKTSDHLLQLSLLQNTGLQWSLASSLRVF